MRIITGTGFNPEIYRVPRKGPVELNGIHNTQQNEPLSRRCTSKEITFNVKTIYPVLGGPVGISFIDGTQDPNRTQHYYFTF